MYGSCEHGEKPSSGQCQTLREPGWIKTNTQPQAAHYGTQVTLKVQKPSGRHDNDPRDSNEKVPGITTRLPKLETIKTDVKLYLHLQHIKSHDRRDRKRFFVILFFIAPLLKKDWNALPPGHLQMKQLCLLIRTFA
jgi:hypothetical protein